MTLYSTDPDIAKPKRIRRGASGSNPLAATNSTPPNSSSNPRSSSISGCHLMAARRRRPNKSRCPLVMAILKPNKFRSTSARPSPTCPRTAPPPAHDKSLSLASASGSRQAASDPSRRANSCLRTHPYGTFLDHGNRVYNRAIGRGVGGQRVGGGRVFGFPN
jgi:hypothetical protein